MTDYLNIGGSPTDEHCAQVGQPDYYEKGRAECVAFKHQLVRAFGEEPDGAHLAVKSFPHDFGNYLEVICYFDDDNEKAREYAFRLEGNTPALWDEEAKAELSRPKTCSL